MKRRDIILATMVIAHPAQGQTADNKETLEQTVGAMFSFWEGGREKLIRRGGDAVAVAITKVVAGRELSNSDVETVLDIIDASFSNLGQVDSPSDREPRTALFVLKHLEAITRADTLRRRILKTRDAITLAFAKAANPPA